MPTDEPRKHAAHRHLKSTPPKQGKKIWQKQTSLVCNTKGIPHRQTRQAQTHPTHRPGVIGIDFWHAVEFSRSGRTPTEASRLVVGTLHSTTTSTGLGPRGPAAPKLSRRTRVHPARWEQRPPLRTYSPSLSAHASGPGALRPSGRSDVRLAGAGAAPRGTTGHFRSCFPRSVCPTSQLS